MSLGATTSAPAVACETAVFTSSSTRRVVVHVRWSPWKSRDAAVAVAHVFAEAHVGHHDESGHSPVFSAAHRALHHAVLGVRLRRAFILLRGNAEEQHARTPAACARRASSTSSSSKAGTPRASTPRAARLCHFLGDEKRKDEVVAAQRGLAHQGAQFGSGAKAAGTAEKIHRAALPGCGIRAKA